MISEFLTKGITPSIVTDEQTASGQQFLRLHLVPDTTALLPVHQITEVLAISAAQVVPIPQMPPWVMGVYNWRGEILWIVDLGQLVGLTPLYNSATNTTNCSAVVIRNTQQNTGSKMLGLLVNHVEDLELCNPDLIQSPPQSAVSPQLSPFLRGYWLKPNGEILLVLDGNSILAGMARSDSAI